MATSQCDTPLVLLMIGRFSSLFSFCFHVARVISQDLIIEFTQLKPMAGSMLSCSTTLGIAMQSLSPAIITLEHKTDLVCGHKHYKLVIEPTSLDMWGIHLEHNTQLRWNLLSLFHHNFFYSWMNLWLRISIGVALFFLSQKRWFVQVTKTFRSHWNNSLLLWYFSER